MFWWFGSKFLTTNSTYLWSRIFIYHLLVGAFERGNEPSVSIHNMRGTAWLPEKLQAFKKDSVPWSLLDSKVRGAFKF
jgi:hypothetical protein